MRRHLAAAAVLTAAQHASAATCSCTPTSYSFTVDYGGTCDASTGFDGDGIDGSICFYTRGGDPEGVSGVGFGGAVGDSPSSEAYESPPRRLDDSRLLRGVDLRRQRDHAARRASELYSARQGLDTVPTVVTSVTFLEADTTPGLSIINQDSTYFETDVADGQVLTYESVSAKLDPDVPLADQADLVPGGVMLVLFGVNAEGTVVQNTVAWGYDTEACVEPFEGIDARIGWLELGSYVGASPAFCPAAATTTEAATTAAVTTAAPTTTEAATTAPATTTEAATTAATTTEAAAAATTEASTTAAATTSQLSMPKSGKAKSSKAMSVSGKSSKMLGGAKSAKKSDAEGGSMSVASKGSKRECPLSSPDPSANRRFSSATRFLIKPAFPFFDSVPPQVVQGRARGRRRQGCQGRGRRAAGRQVPQDERQRQGGEGHHRRGSVRQVVQGLLRQVGEGDARPQGLQGHVGGGRRCQVVQGHVARAAVVSRQGAIISTISGRGGFGGTMNASRIRTSDLRGNVYRWEEQGRLWRGPSHLDS